MNTTDVDRTATFQEVTNNIAPRFTGLECGPRSNVPALVAFIPLQSTPSTEYLSPQKICVGALPNPTVPVPTGPPHKLALCLSPMAGTALTNRQTTSKKLTSNGRTYVCKLCQKQF